MRLPALAALLLIALPAAPARAAESYDNCTGFVDSLPAVITTQGVWCLRKDLATAITTGAAITIANNNVTLDCNHFKLGGLAAGAGTEAMGVFADTRLAFTMRHCNVRGFQHGVRLFSGAGHLVEGNRFEGNTYVGIRLLSDQAIVRGNTVLDTGGSLPEPAAAVGIAAIGDGLVIHDNVIMGVDPLSATGVAYGINAGGTDSGAASVARNTISGLDPTTTGAVFGIYVGLGSSFIRDNTLHGPGLASPAGIGVHCGGDQHTASGNLISQFVTAVDGCFASGNVVNPN